ncbi:CHAT domain-containing protein [Streptomyces sp. NPDC060209]|uniref:CHAT domain-containing protein n=1 Tax=Streptomyces sp. NPDC060209 TaxID=3347073 RepID=UPI0036569C28
MVRPPMDEDARRLLAVIDTMPVRIPERERVIAALDRVATTEWTRARIGLSDNQLGALRLANQTYSPYDLAHVLDVASTAARRYEFEHVGVGLIAVALVATTRPGQHTEDSGVDVVAEAFGLGHLENAEEISNQHLLRLEGGLKASDDGRPTGRIIWGTTPEGKRWHGAATVAQRMARGVTVGMLLSLALRGDDGWIAWAVAFAAVLSSQDSRKEPLHLADDVSIGSLSLRWPWLGCLAALATVSGLESQGALITALYMVLPLIAHLGEAKSARQLRMRGPELRGTGKHTAALLSVVDGYAVRCRLRREGLVLLLAVAPAAVVAYMNGSGWPLYALVAAFTARSLTVPAALVAVMVLVAGGSIPLLALSLAGGAVARAADAWCGRPPQAPVPPVRLPLSGVFSSGGRALLRARRVLRAGRPSAALRELEAAGDAEQGPAARVLRGWALLECGHPGEAKSAVRETQAGLGGTAHLITCLAELDLANTDAAEHALAEFRRTSGPTTGWAQLQELTAHVRLSLLRQLPGLTESIAQAVPRRVTRRNLLKTAALLRLTAESALPSALTLAVYVSGAAVFLVRRASPDSLFREFGLLGSGRTLALESARCAALVSLVDLREPSGADAGTVQDAGTAGAAGYLLRMDRPIEAAACLNAVADRIATAPQHRLAALDSRIETLAVLNATRHELPSSEERHRWWRVFGLTVEKAMEQAASGQDWDTLAELIESARLQLDPGKNGSTFDSERATSPFIRVRGVSRMESAHWFRPEQRPPAYALEDMAGIAVGFGAWWWSTWVSGKNIFWSLVPPTGPVSGGVLRLDEQPLAGALSDLRDALPTRYPGESVEDWEERVLDSPLLIGPPAAEASLARRLGGLLPRQLAHELAAGDGPLRLAIAPAGELAHIPWPAIGIPDGEGGDLRLVERCTAVLVPPAGLLAALAGRDRPQGSPPLALAVIDPGGDLPWVEEYEQLLGARRMLSLVPAGVETVTPGSDLSVEEFAAMLRTLDPETSAVFACHTEQSGDALSCGIRLRPGNDDASPRNPSQVLTSRMLIENPERYSMPRQVLLLACDSSDLRNVSAGEWLVLAPAMLWAGSDRLVVTSYPVIDAADDEEADGEQDGGEVIDRYLVTALLERRELGEALREVQIEQLGRWRSTGREGAPVHWGGHLAMGAYGNVSARTWLPPSRRCYVHAGVLELLDSAAKDSATAGRHLLTGSDLVVELAVYGFAEELPTARRLIALFLLRPYEFAVSRRASKNPVPAVRATPDESVYELLRSAAAIARAAGHAVVNVEHLLVAVLGASGRSAFLARTLSGWDGRQPEVVKELIGDTQEGFQDTSLPETPHLTADTVSAVYGALDAHTPGPQDSAPWYTTDR